MRAPVLLYVPAPAGGPSFLAKAKAAAAPEARGPAVGERIEFLSDALTDKGPATGEITGVKITVDGLYVTVKFGDAQQMFSWDDLEAGGADVRGDLWMVKSHPITHPGPASRAQAEAGNFRKRRIAWRGLTLRVENEAGTIREGNGWSTRMLVPYGEVEDTVGLDGDRVDVFIGPFLEEATRVFVVHQRKYGDWTEHDEDKVMLGLLSEEEAAVLYLQHYDDPRFLGPITTMPVEEFVARCKGDEDVTRLGKSWFGDADLLKALSKKLVTVPGYYKADGTYVPPHQKHVHYNDEHTFEQMASGGVSHSQKLAHKELAKEDWFHKLTMDEKAVHVMALATDKQDAASASAAVSGWKAAAKAGKNPSGAQWAAFQKLSKDKQAALYDEIGTAGLAHLKAPTAEERAAAAEAAVAPAPAHPPGSPEAVKQAPFGAPGHDVISQMQAKEALDSIKTGGSHYQKEALKKLSADPAWQKLLPHFQHVAVLDLYKQLQAAASQAAAVSMAKKALLASKIPSPAQHHALVALKASNAKKFDALYHEVGKEIGFAQLEGLLAHGGMQAAAPPKVLSDKNATKPAPATLPIPHAATAPPKLTPDVFHSIPYAIGIAPNSAEMKKACEMAAAGDIAGLLLQISSISAAKAKTKGAVLAITKKAATLQNVSPNTLHAMSAWFDAMYEGKNPTASQWEAFDANDKAVQDAALGALLMSFSKAHDESKAALGFFKDHQNGTPAAAVAAKAAESKPIPIGKPNHVLNLTGGKVMALAGKAAKINGIDPDDVKAWLEHPSKMGAHHVFWSLTSATDQKFFHKWIGAADHASSMPYVKKCKALAVASLFGVHDNFLGTDGVFHGKYSNHEPVTDVATIKAAAVKKLAGLIVASTRGEPVPTPAAESVASYATTITAPKATFHNTSDGHHKEWSYHVAGNKLVTEYGKIGGTQQKTVKEFADGATAQDAAQKLAKEKLAKGYTLQFTDYGHKVPLPGGVPVLDAAIKKMSPTATDSGPKDGDTKQGADGMLVFKDGHWHKQQISGLSSEEVDSIVGFGQLKVGGKAKALLDDAMKLAISGDIVGLIGIDVVLDKMNAPNTKKVVGKLVSALSHHIDGGQQPSAAAASPKAAPPVATPIPKGAAVKPGEPTDMSGWTQTGPKKGTNPGGTFTDKNGTQWYCKFPASEDIARNELLAAKFYQMLGANVPLLKLVKKDGKVGVASKWADGLKKVDAAKLAAAPGVHEGFILDAWLGNWDVVGATNDNLLVGPKGAMRIDVGGALVYRAQGGKKTDFGDTVPELDTMLDPAKNPKAAAVFSKTMSKAALDSGLARLNMLKESQIEELVDKIGPGSPAEKKALAATLIARRAFILKKFDVPDQWKNIPKLDPTKLPVNPKDLPKPIDFENFGGSGKGLSSKAWLNKQNTIDSQKLVEFAAKGNLIALKDYKYEAIDKESGKSLGMKPITDHPSNKVKEQWAELIELLQSIAAPSIPTLEMPSLGSVSALEEISDFVGSFKPTERPETVATEHRLGFFMALNQIDDIHDLIGGIKWHFLKSAEGSLSPWLAETKKKFAALSSIVKAYIHAVQDTGWVNHLWSQGKATTSISSHGLSYSGGTQTLAAKVYAESVELPEGTILRRGMSDTTAGKLMSKQLLSAKPGLVIQNTDSMCTSFYESHGWGGDIQMTIRCAKGCKASPSWASGRFGSEHEITTLPGQRYVVLAVEKSSSGVKLDVLMLPPHQGYIAELGKLAGLGKALQSVAMFFRRIA